MRILVFNVGSSSVKYEVFDSDESILKGERQRLSSKKDFARAVKSILSEVNSQGIEIDAIGHRVVHGGDIESTSKITASLIRKIEAAKFVREHKGQVCPMNWKPGAKTLKPGVDLVGKI